MSGSKVERLIRYIQHRGVQEADQWSAVLRDLLAHRSPITGRDLTKRYEIICGGGGVVEQIVAQSGYNWVNSRITSATFPLRQGPVSRDTIRLVEFGKEVTGPEAVYRLARLGLVRPTPEQAIRFGRRYPKAQLHGPIAFPHVPWHDPETGVWCILALTGLARERVFGLYPFYPEWLRSTCFAGVERSELVRK